MQPNTTASIKEERTDNLPQGPQKGMMKTINKVKHKGSPCSGKKYSNAPAVDTLFTTTESASYNHSQDSLTWLTQYLRFIIS